MIEPVFIGPGSIIMQGKVLTAPSFEGTPILTFVSAGQVLEAKGELVFQLNASCLVSGHETAGLTLMGLTRPHGHTHGGSTELDDVDIFRLKYEALRPLLEVSHLRIKWPLGLLRSGRSNQGYTPRICHGHAGAAPRSKHKKAR